METRIDAFLQAALVVAEDEQSRTKLCKDELSFLYAQGYADNTTKNAISLYRAALKTVNVPCLEAFNALMHEPSETKAARKTAYVRDTWETGAYNLHPLVDVVGMRTLATTFLIHERALLVGLGLEFALGRRSYEVFVTGEIEACGDHAVLFQGQAKGRDDGETFQQRRTIPTLLPSASVVEAWHRLRQMKDCSRFHPNAPWTHPKYRRSEAFQQHLGKEYRQAFHKHFARFFEAGASPHALRAAYACIAYHLYAPPTTSEERFIADVMGHRPDDRVTYLTYHRYFVAKPTGERMPHGYL